MGRHLPQAWAWEGGRGASWEGRAWEAGGKGLPLDGAPEMQVWEGEMQIQAGKCRHRSARWENARDACQCGKGAGRDNAVDVCQCGKGAGRGNTRNAH